MKPLVFSNPGSGRHRNRGQKANTVRRVLDSRGIDYRFEEASGISELEQLIQSVVDQGTKTVWVIGGDGTVSLVARHMLGTEMTLGIIPTGSGNGLARHLRIPLDPARAVTTLLEGSTLSIDTGLINGSPFLVTCGIGLDADIADRFARAESRGLQTYLKEGLRAWRTRREREYEITADQESIRTSALIVTVANASQYGNEARIAPRASLRDGMLDVAIVSNLSTAKALVGVRRLFNGTIDRSPAVTHFQARHITIQREEPGPAHFDGEPIELGEELTIGIRPASLKVLVPNGVNGI